MPKLIYLLRKVGDKFRFKRIVEDQAHFETILKSFRALGVFHLYDADQNQIIVTNSFLDIYPEQEYVLFPKGADNRDVFPDPADVRL